MRRIIGIGQSGQSGQISQIGRIGRIGSVVCLIAGSVTALAQGLSPTSIDADARERLVRRLVEAYPDALETCDELNMVCFQVGRTLIFDDGIRKSTFEERLARASLFDQMSMPYPKGWPFDIPGEDFNPGRLRHVRFFRAMYGDTKEEVGGRLRRVAWPDRNSTRFVMFTTVNNAAGALERVRDSLLELPEAARAYVADPIGTFVWRPIAGTKQLSPHSFGIAIDFQLPKGLHRYWRWDGDRSTEYPEELARDEMMGLVVQAFEAQGFIWGGKWRHYDSMHFEYRPELLGEEQS